MKIFNLVIFLIASFIIFAITCIGFLDKDLITYIYLGGGSTGLETMVFPNVWFQIVLIIISILIFLFFKKKLLAKIIILSFLFFIWIMGERVVSIGLFPDTSINSGWFYNKTKSIKLTSEKKEPDQIFLETSFEKLSFWRIRIINEDINFVIFVGPMIWDKTISLFYKYNMKCTANNAMKSK